MLTNEIILSLIAEEKIISSPPSREDRPESQHLRNDFKLTSTDGTKWFTVFLRKHKDFKENFSIGLIYHAEDGSSLQLFRCNGKHGEIVEDILNPIPHFGFHTHIITGQLLENNITDPKHSELTKEYASFEQALGYFCNRVNIKDAEKYFPNIRQLNLFKTE